MLLILQNTHIKRGQIQGNHPNGFPPLPTAVHACMLHARSRSDAFVLLVNALRAFIIVGGTNGRAW